MLAVITVADLFNWLWPVTLIAGAVVGYIVFKSTYSKENTQLKDDLIDTQRKKIEQLDESVQGLQRRDDEQQKMIDGLSKELNVWRDVPIKQLADDYHKLAEAITDINQLIRLLVPEDALSKTRKRSK